MPTADYTNLQKIMHEPGVEDLRPLGLAIIGAFARAIKAEREAGLTTPEAEEQLAKAITAIDALP